MYSSSQGCHTATGTHMPHGITQCYLPPGRGDIPALNPAEAGTRLSNAGGMQDASKVKRSTTTIEIVSCRWSASSSLLASDRPSVRLLHAPSSSLIHNSSPLDAWKKRLERPTRLRDVSYSASEPHSRRRFVPEPRGAVDDGV